jgi:subtilisin family serine protease
MLPFRRRAIIRVFACSLALAMLALPSHALGAGGRILVKLRPGTSSQAATAALDSAGARQVGAIADLAVRELRVAPGETASALRKLNGDPRVAFAEPDLTLTAQRAPNDYWWPSEWAPPRVNAPGAWDLTVGSPNTVIAVLDSGVDFSQPDLQGSFVAGRDLVNSDDNPSDDFGHGTQVAGVAAARSDNGVGVASYCWRCSIMPVKVLGANGAGSVSNIAAGITWASDHGARVINLSLGTTTSSSTLAAAAQYAHDRGAVLVAAAGNSSSTAQTYPAALPTVIGVAGTDSLDRLTGTSNYGSWVKVAAPGCNFTTGLGSWYGTFCGTSSASPVVAGIAGLAFSLVPGATNAEVERAIESSAVPTGFVQYGRVDAAATLSALAPPSTGTAPVGESPPPVSESPPPAVEALTTTFSGSISAKQPSKSFSLTMGAGTAAATLAFTKASSMTVALVAPDGSTVGTASGPSGARLETAVALGTYRYVVSGGSGGKGSASFTLAVTYPPPA